MIKIYDRKNKKYYEEKEKGNGVLKLLYNTFIGRIILKIIIHPVISKLGSIYNKSYFSKFKISRFIKTHNIVIEDFEEKNYKSFNDFFTRDIKSKKRPFSKDKIHFISPADSKLLVYNITEDLKLNIKDSTYTLNELVNNEEDLSEYKNGLCLVFRLTIDDYHHYCYPDNGVLIKNNFIKGKLHTVRSISKNYKIYKVNQREYSILNTENFGEIIYIEVGALMVGKIINSNKCKFLKGEEKGHFELGGSTIVILLKDNQIKIDKDILENSKKDIETKVRYREKIGVKIK